MQTHIPVDTRSIGDLQRKSRWGLRSLHEQQCPSQVEAPAVCQTCVSSPFLPETTERELWPISLENNLFICN